MLGLYGSLPKGLLYILFIKPVNLRAAMLVNTTHTLRLNVITIYNMSVVYVVRYRILHPINYI